MREIQVLASERCCRHGFDLVDPESSALLSIRLPTFKKQTKNVLQAYTDS